MKYTKAILQILLIPACTSNINVYCTELTIFAYVQHPAQQARQLLAKILITLTDSEKTVAHIKNKILIYNSHNNNCLNLPDSITAEQLPDIRHMSRVQSCVTTDEISKFGKGAAVSIILQES